MKTCSALSLLSVLSLGTCTEYDLETAGTPANRKGFEDSFGFPADTNVSQIYYYADELGADVRY